MMNIIILMDMKIQIFYQYKIKILFRKTKKQKTKNKKQKTKNKKQKTKNKNYIYCNYCIFFT